MNLIKFNGLVRRSRPAKSSVVRFLRTHNPLVPCSTHGRPTNICVTKRDLQPVLKAKVQQECAPAFVAFMLRDTSQFYLPYLVISGCCNFLPMDLRMDPNGNLPVRPSQSISPSTLKFIGRAAYSLQHRQVIRKKKFISRSINDILPTHRGTYSCCLRPEQRLELQ